MSDRFPALFTPLAVGPLRLPNRVLMAPLTRCRAEEGHVPGPLMATYYAQRATAGLIIAAAIDAGAVDAVAFGSAFLANPDLPERLRRGAPLNSPDPATFYSSGPAGYTDYPTLAPA